MDVGVGTGINRALNQHVKMDSGKIIGLDISIRRINQAKKKACYELCLAEGENLPFAPDSFDHIFCLYVLNLLTQTETIGCFVGFQRVLIPGGKIVVACLTEGYTQSNRAFVAGWKLEFSISQQICAGCQPMQLTNILTQSGLSIFKRQTVFQFGMPSEVIMAEN